MPPPESRHTAASSAIVSGADVTGVQLIDEHTTATTTLGLYGHLFPDRLDELADRLDDAMGVSGVNQDPADDVDGEEQ